MMCHTADGRLDGCATLYCNSWDVIGGLLLVHEAGGFVKRFPQRYRNSINRTGRSAAHQACAP